MTIVLLSKFTSDQSSAVSSPRRSPANNIIIAAGCARCGVSRIHARCSAVSAERLFEGVPAGTFKSSSTGERSIILLAAQYLKNCLIIDVYSINVLRDVGLPEYGLQAANASRTAWTSQSRIFEISNSPKCCTKWSSLWLMHLYQLADTVFFFEIKNRLAQKAKVRFSEIKSPPRCSCARSSAALYSASYWVLP